jgi:thymidylate synthase ThyX
MIEILGKGGIRARVIADSITAKGKRITTFELEYMRYFHSELMTHRMLSKNAASSRAIPILSMIEHIKDNTAMPIYWGKNQPGMKAREELSDIQKQASIGVWKAARDSAIAHATVLSAEGNHKQTVNRILEPYMMMKTVVTGTEWANFLYLRNHPDAQPEFKELAQCMSEALHHSIPVKLNPGQWHLPYVVTSIEDGDQKYWMDDTTEMLLEDAIKVSVSCCAQVSYRKLDDTLEKARRVYDMLNVGSNTEPAHASPLEHQATPMITDSTSTCFGWENGVTHIDRIGDLWSGNFRGWIQNRKMTANEARW